MSEINSGHVVVKCQEISQPIGTFYIGVMNSSDLIDISFADIRKLSREIEDYTGIQRPLSDTRVEEIEEYVNTVDATFPTGVILAIESNDVQDYDEITGIMKIRNDGEVAKVIDGQHRIAGLKGFKGEKFQVNVVIFIDMELEDQAMTFAKINLAQTRVNKSLVYDLFEYTKSRSPTKTTHNIARLLNSKQKSPFFERIKILGTATKPLQTLTQATFVEALLRLISGTARDASLDRDLLKREKRLKRAPDGETTLVLRNLFIDEEDARISKLIWDYFGAIRSRWLEAWEATSVRGNILPRTNGFRGFMRFFPIVFTYLGGPNNLPTKIDFLEIFDKFTLEDGDFTTENYPPGSTGESRLFTDLKKSFDKVINNSLAENK